MIKTKVIIGVLLLSVVVVSAQKKLQHLTPNEGLSEIQCFDIFQDSKKYIWIGTSAGVNKYDGKDVKIFDRSNGLISDHIYSFKEDSHGRIWVNNINSEPIYIKGDQVYNRHTNPELEKLKGRTYLVGWCEDDEGKVWFGHKEGKLGVISQDTVFDYKIPESVDTMNYVLYGLFAYNEEIILTSSMSIKSINPQTLSINWEVENPIKLTCDRNLLYEDKIYLFSLFDAFVFDLKSRKFKHLTREDGGFPIYDIREVYEKVLISTSKGVSMVEGDVVKSFTVDESVDSIPVSAIQEGLNGDIWISTLYNGVYRQFDIDTEPSKYAKYSNIIFIHQHTKDSVFVLQENWNINLLVNDELIWTKSLKKRDENKFNNIFFKDGELWVVDKYQMHRDVEGENKPFPIYNREVNYNDKTNEFCLIGTRGLIIINNLDNLFQYRNMAQMMLEGGEYLTRYYFNNPYDFEVNSDGSYWLGCEDGLFLIKDKQVQKIEIPAVTGSITDIRKYDNHLVGVNYGKGVFSYNIETNTGQLISREDGLTSNYFALMSINNSDIWVSHAKGISLIRYSDGILKHVRNYGEEHGIPSGRITTLKVFDDVCHFVVNGKAFSLRSEPVVNEALEIIMDQSELSYYAGESHSIDFDCINYTFGDKIQYKYRLKPLETKWKEANSEKIELDYIPAGNYELQLKAEHPLNLSSTITSRAIHIKNRWYNDIYFRLSLTILFGFLLYFFIRINAISFNVLNFKLWIEKKARKYFANEKRNSFNIKDIHGVVHLLKIADIKYIKSSGNYLEFHTDDKKLVSRMTMSNAVHKLQLWTNIQRVHRSYMVNLNRIVAVDHRYLKVGDSNIPFTDRYKSVIEQELQLKKYA